MDKALVEQKLQEITQKIVKEYQPEKIILFGSWAWGEPHNGSDLDLFIIKESKERRIERERRIQRSLLGSRLPVDVLVYTPGEVDRRLWMEDFFIRKIINKGKILYSTT